MNKIDSDYNNLNNKEKLINHLENLINQINEYDDIYSFEIYKKLWPFEINIKFYKSEEEKYNDLLEEIHNDILEEIHNDISIDVIQKNEEGDNK